MAYQEKQAVRVIVGRERGGFVVYTRGAEIVHLQKDRVVVKLPDGTEKRVAYPQRIRSEGGPRSFRLAVFS